MYRVKGLSVEFVRTAMERLNARVGFAESARKLEDGLPQSLKAASGYCGMLHGEARSFVSAFCVAVCLCACAPLAMGQKAVLPMAADASTAAAATPNSAEAAADKKAAPSGTTQNGATQNGGSTPVQVPANPSGGMTTEQFRLAQQQGKADTAILDWVLANSGPVKGDMRAGELRVAFTVTPAEGWWDKGGGGTLVWHEAPENNVHLRIFVLDVADGRLVQGLNLCAKLIDANGNEQSVPTDAGWYPLMNAYGGNVPLVADSSYALRVTIDPPMPRHGGGDSLDGDSFDRSLRAATVAEFPAVPIAQETVAGIPLATTVAWAHEAELLKPANAALSAAITALWQVSASGMEQPEGDYFVGYALDRSGLALKVGGGRIHLKNMIEFSGNDDVRLKVMVRDSRTGRLIAGVRPTASLIALGGGSDGKTFGPGELFLSWHPWLTHYGRNTRIPGKDVYKLRVHFEAPGFRRWGRQSERFGAAADVEFGGVALRQAAKPAAKDETKSPATTEPEKQD